MFSIDHVHFYNPSIIVRAVCLNPCSPSASEVISSFQQRARSYQYLIPIIFLCLTLNSSSIWLMCLFIPSYFLLVSNIVTPLLFRLEWQPQLLLISDLILLKLSLRFSIFPKLYLRFGSLLSSSITSSKYDSTSPINLCTLVISKLWFCLTLW